MKGYLFFPYTAEIFEPEQSLSQMSAGTIIDVLGFTLFEGSHLIKKRYSSSFEYSCSPWVTKWSSSRSMAPV